MSARDFTIHIYICIPSFCSPQSFSLPVRDPEEVHFFLSYCILLPFTYCTTSSHLRVVGTGNISRSHYQFEILRSSHLRVVGTGAQPKRLWVYSDGLHLTNAQLGHFDDSPFCFSIVS